MKSVFHPGELAVQERAGVLQQAGKVGRILRTAIEPDGAEFLADLPLLVLASVDAAGRPWASAMTGSPPLLRVVDEAEVELFGAVAAGDPLHANLASEHPLAILALDPSTRSRYRVNGIAETTAPGRFHLRVLEVFGNCRKYIQVRHLQAVAPVRGTGMGESDTLTASQREWIGRSDTFFVATIAEGGADASHRGGNPGFVHVQRDGSLTIPDYSGNNMFQTLGNIAVSGTAGLLFVDFENGRTLQLTGRAEIDWDPGHAAAFAGANRLLRVFPERIVETADAVAVRGGMEEYSPFNP
jgi:predicted pyridoxine 5'-phosphate oxidase superfamily flavin-nucleotide-binding protein